MSTVECYQCHQLVRSLKDHKSSGQCKAKTPSASSSHAAKTPNASTGNKSFNTPIKCYDCQEMVFDLRAHKSVCSKTSTTITTTAPSSHFPIPNIQSQPLISTINPSQMPIMSPDVTTVTSMSHVKSTEVQVIPATSLQSSKDVFVLVDVSGSMAGTKLTQAKQGLSEIHAHLGDDDRLSIITFDDNAFFKLKPRANGQLKRQNELPHILERLFARGGTALYDAIYMAVGQIKDKSRESLLVVLTDGEDNTSKHSLDHVLKIIEEYPAITLDIVEIADDKSKSRDLNYEKLASRGRGQYTVIVETEIVQTVVRTITKLIK